jgi:hypothetical protein
MVEPDRNPGEMWKALEYQRVGESIQGKLEDVSLDSADSRDRELSLDALYTIQIPQNKHFNAF